MLGKQPARIDPRTLRFAAYASALPSPPASIDWTGAVKSPWQMLANDRLGDCTIACAGHLEMLWRANVGSSFIPTDDQIIAAYSAITGYDPDTGDNDNGAVEIDVLNYWRKTGIADHKIVAYMAVDHKPPFIQKQFQQALDLFGGVYLGINMPSAWQDATEWRDLPDQKGINAPGSWGGHAVPAVAYDAEGVIVITWGAPLKMTWGALTDYCDEAYAIVTQDWINAFGKSPSGFDLATLQADLTAI
jgi:hypothetical protein